MATITSVGISLLIDNIITIADAAKSGGTLNVSKVFKGFQSMPEDIPISAFPYLALDDGGERVDDVAAQTQNRFYTVIFEIGVVVYDVEKSLKELAFISNQVKTMLEDEDNRQLDGHIWGINIVPFDGENSEKKLFRGRTIATDFWELEDRYLVY